MHKVVPAAGSMLIGLLYMQHVGGGGGGVTCSMIMTELRKPGSIQGYTQVKTQVRSRLHASGMQIKCRGSDLLHDHDRIEEARASDDAAGHQVGSAHMAFQMQVGKFIHLHLTTMAGPSCADGNSQVCRIYCLRLNPKSCTKHGMPSRCTEYR